MLKLLSIILSASSLVFLSNLLDDSEGVKVTVEMPEHTVAGEDFLVTLTIHKGNVLGFARIQQFLPEGFAAEEVESNMAQFITDSNSVKFIWMQMPEGESFSVSYKVRTGAHKRGLQVLNGVLVYIEDEKTEQYVLPPAEINLGTKAELQALSARPDVERKLFATVAELNEYRVELSIRPNRMESAAQFIDRIPEGYEAFEELSHGAEFSFSQGSVRFSWKEMPSDSVFKITYLVRSAQRRTAPAINGMLVYGNSAMDLELDSADMNDELLEQAMKVTENQADLIVDELLANENEKKTQSEPQPTAAVSAVNIPSAKSGIYYKVQIAATIKSPARDNAWFGKYYKLNEPVDLTYHDGWKKYLVGTFDNYQEANRHKKTTRQKVADAFVVAYQDGNRISVKDAIAAKNANQ